MFKFLIVNGYYMNLKSFANYYFKMFEATKQAIVASGNKPYFLINLAAKNQPNSL